MLKNLRKFLQRKVRILGKSISLALVLALVVPTVALAAWGGIFLISGHATFSVAPPAMSVQMTTPWTCSLGGTPGTCSLSNVSAEGFTLAASNLQDTSVITLSAVYKNTGTITAHGVFTPPATQDGIQFSANMGNSQDPNQSATFTITVTFNGLTTTSVINPVDLLMTFGE
jgi:hypothetical protein